MREQPEATLHSSLQAAGTDLNDAVKRCRYRYNPHLFLWMVCAQFANDALTESCTSDCCRYHTRGVPVGRLAQGTFQGTGEAQRWRRPLVCVSAIDFCRARYGRQPSGTVCENKCVAC